MTTPTSALEMKEYLFANTSVEFAEAIFRDTIELDRERTIRNHLREMLRVHRFEVLLWLMHLRVEIPADLLYDSTHPWVGDQTPDQCDSYHDSAVTGENIA